MKEYYIGKSENGFDSFAITLQTDEDGFIGRECTLPDCQPKYFKIKPRAETLDKLTCPYCGNKDFKNKFRTKAQFEYVKSLVMRDAVRTIDDKLKRTFGSLSHTRVSGGMFSVTMEYKSGLLPSVRHYSENKLHRIIECDQCQGEYAVYGISTYCPWCGGGNIEVHLLRSIGIIRDIMSSREVIINEHGLEVGRHLIGNCLEDCVSLFEGFMKKIYCVKLKNKLTDAEYDRKISELGNAFQNFNRACKIYERDLGVDLVRNITDEERQLIESEFAKRHVITHNLGLVDAKYKKQIKTWQNLGQDIPIKPEEVEKVLLIVESVIRSTLPV